MELLVRLPSGMRLLTDYTVGTEREGERQRERERELAEVQQDVEFISSHKRIKNTSKNGTILTEHLLNTSRGLRTPKRTRKISM